MKFSSEVCMYACTFFYRSLISTKTMSETSTVTEKSSLYAIFWYREFLILYHVMMMWSIFDMAEIRVDVVLEYVPIKSFSTIKLVYYNVYERLVFVMLVVFSCMRHQSYSPYQSNHNHRCDPNYEQHVIPDGLIWVPLSSIWLLHVFFCPFSISRKILCWLT